MSVARWAQYQARAIIFVLVVLAVAGAASLLRLPVLLFPRVEFPRVQISLDAGDRPRDFDEHPLGRPVEEAVRGIPGVRDIRSTTSRGSADVDVDFDWGQNMVSATLEVNAELGRISSALPQGTKFDVRRMNPTVFPVIAYSLTSDAHSLVDLRDLALYQLRPALSTVAGVAKVGVQGGEIEEWRVVVSEGKLRSLGMTLADVARALSASNVLTAVGHIQQHDLLYLVVSDTRLKTLDGIRASIVRSGPDGVVRLDDIATVRRDVKPRYVRVTADGHRAVLLNIFQQPGGNTVQIARAIKKKLKEVKKRIPELNDDSVNIANWYDQSGIILKSEGSVRDAIAIGVALAAIVLFVFLRNWKITIIAALAVPAVLAVTLLLLYAMNMSLNIMTLGGMAAAVGLIIDDAIVIVEHITRRLRTGAGAHSDRVVEATRQFTTPLAGSSTSTIIIFVPLAFLSGVTGAFFKALALTMSASLFVSFLVAWLAVPILSAQFLGEKDAKQKAAGARSARVARGYERVMRPLLRHPWVVLIVIAPLLGLGWMAFGHVKSGFMPSIDEGGFVLDYRAPAGTSLEETDRELRQLEAILAAHPAVDTYSRRTGLQLGGGVTEANQGDLFVRLKPFPRPAIGEVMADIRRQVEHSIPGLSIETSQLMEDLIGDLTGVPEPIDIKLFSADEKQLRTVASDIAQAIRQVDGVVEVKNGIVLAGDALEIDVDRVKAAVEGMDPETITKAVNDYVSGTVTTSVHRGQKLIGVRVWVPRDLRALERDVRELPMRAPDGHVFPLERVATLTTITGQPEIDRDNLKRVAEVTGRISGRDLGSTMKDVKTILQKKGTVPSGMIYELGGTYQRQQQSFQGLLHVTVAAFLLVFTLILFVYKRLSVAMAMIVIAFLAICSIFVGLWLTGTELNIMSIMGMTMIVGIVTEVSIFYYSEYLEQPAADAPIERLIAAGSRRGRAIAMTTVAAILALLILALGIGQGAAMLQPLAIAIIAGLIVQMPFVLFVLPALLLLMRSVRSRDGMLV